MTDLLAHMKKIILIIATFLSIGYVMADNGKNAKILLDAQKQIYIDAHEVTVEDYLVYLNQLDKINKSFYNAALPDESVCEELYDTKNIFVPEYFDRPIIGLTLEQIKAYCLWRTDYNHSKKTSKKTTVDYSYQLPTLSQLQMAYEQSDKSRGKLLGPVDVTAKKITGIADNINEVTADGYIVVGASPYTLKTVPYRETTEVGFRCVMVPIQQ